MNVQEAHATLKPDVLPLPFVAMMMTHARMILANLLLVVPTP
jgi:hypothetical protein